MLHQMRMVKYSDIYTAEAVRKQRGAARTKRGTGWSLKGTIANIISK